jgi:folate-binding protein YgfZ
VITLEFINPASASAARTTIRPRALQPLASGVPRLYPISMANAAILNDRAILALEGAETRNLLQGVITNDVANRGAGDSLYAALLTPQGKILFDFIVTMGERAIFLDCAAALANDLVKRLTLYRLRAKVSITLRSDLSVAAVWNHPSAFPSVNAIGGPDPRLPALGIRLIGERNQVEAAIAGVPPGDYDAFRLRLGVPDSADLPPDQVFALDAGMEELHGVSFSKGCYIGQEVTSRMKHRSSARRRFYIAEGTEIPSPGTAVEAQGRELGRITSAKNSHGLALVRLDRLAEAEQNHASVQAAGIPISLRRPDWLNV